LLTLVLSSSSAYAAQGNDSNLDKKATKALVKDDVKKEPLPVDPRGPLPDSLEKWDQWLKDHPDDILGQSNVNITATKAIPWDKFGDADMVLGANAVDSSKATFSYGYFRHAATYDSKNRNLISAMPDIGVYRETKTFWETSYGDVSATWVQRATFTQKSNIISYLSAQIGETYNIASSKTNYDEWYCSKLPYVGYKLKASLDIDNDGGIWVTPDDIYYSSNVSQFWRG